MGNGVDESSGTLNVAFVDGELLDLSSIDASGTGEGLILPQANDVSNATAEGQISWDSDGDTLVVGTNGGQVTLGTGSGDLFAANNLSDLSNAATARTNIGLGGLAILNTAASAQITDDTIVNADINTGAAIADTKLAAISTAGKVANSATTATNANTPSTIVARDGSGNFSAGTITASLTGNVTGNVSGNADTATAMGANGTNCAAGNYPLGVDAGGNAESCTAIGGGGDVTMVGDSPGPTAFTGNDDGNTLTFEGSTSDSNETILTVNDPSADVTITLPASTGTVVTTGAVWRRTQTTTDDLIVSCDSQMYPLSGGCSVGVGGVLMESTVLGRMAVFPADGDTVGHADMKGGGWRCRLAASGWVEGYVLCVPK